MMKSKTINHFDLPNHAKGELQSGSTPLAARIILVAILYNLKRLFQLDKAIIEETTHNGFHTRFGFEKGIRLTLHADR